jgi:hypothetical protein
VADSGIVNGASEVEKLSGAGLMVGRLTERVDLRLL